MAQTKSKPPKAKRTPPPTNETSADNLQKQPSSKIVGLNLSISAELRREFKQFAAARDMSMAELFGRCFDKYKGL